MKKAGGLIVDPLDVSEDEDTRARKKAIARSSRLITMAFFLHTNDWGVRLSTLRSFCSSQKKETTRVWKARKLELVAHFLARDLRMS